MNGTIVILYRCYDPDGRDVVLYTLSHSLSCFIAMLAQCLLIVDQACCKWREEQILPARVRLMSSLLPPSRFDPSRQRLLSLQHHSRPREFNNHRVVDGGVSQVSAGTSSAGSIVVRAATSRRRWVMGLIHISE